MITLKRMNVVRQVTTEEQAAKLEKQGFDRMGGAAEDTSIAPVTEAAIAQMGEAMFERLSKNMKEAVAKATASGKGKAAKDGGQDDKEGQDGADTDQQNSGNGQK